jgi:hypothetical protein
MVGLQIAIRQHGQFGCKQRPSASGPLMRLVVGNLDRSAKFGETNPESVAVGRPDRAGGGGVLGMENLQQWQRQSPGLEAPGLRNERQDKQEQQE